MLSVRRIQNIFLWSRRARSVEWSRKGELRTKVGLCQWEGKNMGKSRGFNRKKRVNMLEDRQGRKGSCSYRHIYVYTHTPLFWSLILISWGALEEVWLFHMHVYSGDRDASTLLESGSNFSSLEGNPAAYTGYSYTRTTMNVFMLKAGSENNQCKSLNSLLRQARLRKNTQHLLFSSPSS